MANQIVEIFLRYKRIYLIYGILVIISGTSFAQQTDSLPTLSEATLENCIQYALQHNPDIQNAKIDQQITETQIQSKLADWYPQVNFTYNLQHNIQLPTFIFNGNVSHSGSYNTSGANFSLTQNIFNRDVLLATRTARDVRQAASENTQSQKIDLASVPGNPSNLSDRLAWLSGFPLRIFFELWRCSMQS